MAVHTVLFTGDSITDSGRRDDPDGLGDGYVRRLATAPALAGARVVNTGISGDLSSDLAVRWAGDVLAHAPAVLSVLIGINDVWRRYDGAGRVTSAAAYESTMRDTLNTLSPDVRLVLIEPFVLPADPMQQRWEAEDLGPKRAVVRSLAAAHGAVIVPAQDILSAAASREGSAALAPDGVHPSARGHQLLAEAWLAAVPPEWLRP
ncbi:SGNH/GDSL hydrolase family protein [Actinoplanes palleronii]|uniref:Lysophospholipase n=1 Tax=Actinoplanes palleronii TaxID=113570 RepID=A0ABQ4BDR2_9ACTN|nr:SGNH/GDSL hydrolase family protein [Actinoplanes palleronii]GIE68826.1 lysophospholipase [Actinoplanes palleronii]